jgi:hypothetical protein
MTDECRLLPHSPNEVAAFMRLFEVLAGKYDTPKGLEWNEECWEYPYGEDHPALRRLVSAVLSKAADRSDTLTLKNLKTKLVVDALTRHAPRLRHLTPPDPGRLQVRPGGLGLGVLAGL